MVGNSLAKIRCQRYSHSVIGFVLLLLSNIALETLIKIITVKASHELLAIKI
jgi:hypothetical protein